MATENIKVFCVYKHTSPHGKIYIGQTKQNPKFRWRNGEGYKHNQYFYKAIQKYGWNNFKHEIVCSNLTGKEADWLEKYLISYYDSSNRNYGYNIEGGGNNKKTISDETKLKQSKAHVGQVSGRKGKKLSDETKGKISVARKGKPSNHRKPIKINDIIYPSSSSAAKALNISTSHLCSIIKGRKNNTLNLKIEFIWKEYA